MATAKKADTKAKKDVEPQNETQQQTAGTGSIQAENGALRSTFSQREWDALGKDKGGWKKVVEEPAEVKELREKQAAKGNAELED